MHIYITYAYMHICIWLCNISYWIMAREESLCRCSSSLSTFCSWLVVWREGHMRNWMYLLYRSIALPAVLPLSTVPLYVPPSLSPVCLFSTPSLLFFPLSPVLAFHSSLLPSPVFPSPPIFLLFFTFCLPLPLCPVSPPSFLLQGEQNKFLD